MLNIFQAAPLALVRTLPPEDLPIPEDPLPPIWKKTTVEYIEQLSASIKLRVQDIPRLPAYGPIFSFPGILNLKELCRESPNSPRIAILFSGGIDCTLVAYLSHLLVVDSPNS
jgi:predicted PP-loop superfamily ATPase